MIKIFILQLIEIYESGVDVSAWKKIGNFTYNGFSSVSFEGIVYLFGGISKEYVLSNKIFKFDNENNFLDEVLTYGSKPLPRRGHSASIFGHLMIIHGGTGDNAIFNDLYLYDIKKSEWKRIFVEGKHLISRTNHCSQVDFKNRLIIWGGFSLNGLAYKTYFIDLLQMKIFKPRLTGTIPSPSEFSSCLTFEETFWVFGGIGEINVVENLFILDLNNFSWSIIDIKSPSKRQKVSILKRGDELIFFGGLDSENNICFTEKWIYNLKLGEWLFTLDTIGGEGQFHLVGKYIISFGNGCFNQKDYSIYKKSTLENCNNIQCNKLSVCNEIKGCICPLGLYGASCEFNNRCFEEVTNNSWLCKEYFPHIKEFFFVNKKNKINQPNLLSFDNDLSKNASKYVNFDMKNVTNYKLVTYSFKEIESDFLSKFNQYISDYQKIELSEDTKTLNSLKKYCKSFCSYKFFKQWNLHRIYMLLQKWIYWD